MTRVVIAACTLFALLIFQSVSHIFFRDFLRTLFLVFYPLRVLWYYWTYIDLGLLVHGGFYCNFSLGILLHQKNFPLLLSQKLNSHIHLDPRTSKKFPNFTMTFNGLFSSHFCIHLAYFHFHRFLKLTSFFMLPFSLVILTQLIASNYNIIIFSLMTFNSHFHNSSTFTCFLFFNTFIPILYIIAVIFILSDLFTSSLG